MNEIFSIIILSVYLDCDVSFIWLTIMLEENRGFIP